MENSQESEPLYYDSGIDPDNQHELIEEPFNPEDISIDSKVVPMETCLRRLTQGSIILNPDFQRKEVWKDDKKSQLIESLMLKIPLPMFYVSADEKNNYTVVDGLQRLSTIRNFILGDKYIKTQNEYDKGKGFPLQDLEFWTIYNGKTFNELPIHIKNRILETEFQFTVINPGTPEEVKRNVFKRLNTGGLPLTSQEIRNALYIGHSTTLLNELSTYKSFVEATDHSIKSIRMEDKELILRFLAFLIRDYNTYKRTISVDTFLSETMIIINAIPAFNSREYIKFAQKTNVNKDDFIAYDMKKIKELFKNAMTRSFKLFEKHTFRKSYGGNRRTRINKCLFEMWGVLLTTISEAEYNRLYINKKHFLKEYNSILEQRDFQSAISQDSMKHTAVKFRFDILKNLLNKYII